MDKWADLLEKQIKDIGEKNMVQVVSDNGSNYKLPGGILEIRIPTLFWTSCIAHCIDLMLEDIGKIPSIKKSINQARKCTTFIYRHGRVLHALREKTNRMDLVRIRATRFVTTFLTLQSLKWNRPALRLLFTDRNWDNSKLSRTENDKSVCESVLSSIFWQGVEDCLLSAQPLVQVLQIADGDERPALAEFAYAINYAKTQIRLRFGSQKLAIQNKALKIIDDRWSSQMGKPFYRATLFLNPGKYFDILERDPDWASLIREDFNDVLEKMVTRS